MGMFAQAGSRDANVRSDCWVGLQLRDSGGVDLAIRSKVDIMYGQSLERLVQEGLAFFGIEHAVVRVQDAGAMPWVVMAKLEACVRQVRPDEKREWLPEPSPTFARGTTRDRFRRSRLYLPGSQPKFMLNARVHRPDGVILDLEDSVAPAVKDEALLMVRNALVAVDFGESERMVRINQGERGLREVPFLVRAGVHLILIPKVEDAAQVQAVDRLVTETLSVTGSQRDVFLMPIVESAKGAWFAYDIASACPRIAALTIGLEDYTADIGTQRTAEAKESVWARAQVVNAAKAAQVQAIDTVFSDVADEAGLRASVEEAKGLGFEGKGCIHPRQIGPIHEAFAPSPAEIERALKIRTAFADAQAKGQAAVSLGSKMIDPPVVKRALRTVAMAEQLGMLPVTASVSAT